MLASAGGPQDVVLVAAALAAAGALLLDGPRQRAFSMLVALAVVLVLYAFQALYSTDLEQAVKNTCFFYVPFALLLPLLVPLPWSRRLLIVCLGVVAGLAVIFVGVAFVEFATNRLLIPNSK